MSRFETVTTPIVAGAARRTSYTYALPQQAGVGAFAGMDLVNGRPGGIETASYATFTTTGAPPAGDGMQIYKGRPTIAITSSAATGRILLPNFAGINRPLTMPFQSTRGTGDTSLVDDFRCWSASVILAFDAIPGAVTGDIGLVIGAGTRFNIRTPANQFCGMEIGPSNTGVISVFIRQHDLGAVTFNQATPDQPDMTQFNSYEIRMIGATALADGQVQFLLNGRVQFALPYGAGTVLPDQNEGVFWGFTPGIGNFEALAATTRMYIAPGSFVIKAAPDIVSLL
jgi:hypothetical protein